MARHWCLFALVLFFAPIGDLSAQIFVFEMRGAQEAPPTPTAATGGCMGVLDQGAATFDLTCVHNVTGATLMHIHRGPAGVNGPIVFNLGDPSSPVTATWSGMTPADVADLLAGNLYVNVHSGGRPSGEVRGQILPRTIDTVNFTADGRQAVPPNGSVATADCVADLDNDATFLAVQCTHDLPAPTEAHLHEAPAFENGPVVFTFASPSSPISENVPMTPQLVADFAALFLYVEIHGAGEEIRGQISSTPPDAPPLISIGDVSLAEGNVETTNFAFPIDLSAAVTHDVSVTWETSGGTATAGVDYAAAGPATVTIPAGETTTTVTVLVSGDLTFEPDETFGVALSNPVGATIADGDALGTILNDDAEFADLSVVKTGPAQAVTGASVAFTIAVANAGPVAASNVVVTDPLAPGATLESAVASQGTCSGTTTIVCNLGAIASGGSASVTVVVTAPATAQDLVNSASVAADQVDLDASNDSGSATVAILAPEQIPLASAPTMALLALALALAGVMILRR